MEREEVAAKIRKGLAEAGFADAEVRVQPDPYDGWQIAVVSDAFTDVSIAEREEATLKYVDRASVEWLDVLTPEEREWAGPLPRDEDLSDMPLWPEAMARSIKEKEDLLFLSDLEEDIETPITATFYSLRGGVGRSTALGYAARILGSQGHTVLCVDMDLEAPGLAALFGLEEKVQKRQGLVPLLFDTDQGKKPDIMEHILRVSESDDLYCLPAGRPSANYARMLRFIDPTAYYREEKNPLVELVQRLKEDLTFKPDVLLFDARTGINMLSGPLLFDLSDLAVIAFFPHPQAKEGTGALVQSLLSSYTNRSNGRRLTPEPRFVVSPIPASNIAEVEKKYRHRAEDWITAWLEPIDGEGRSGESFSDNQPDLTHFVTYREAVATSDTIQSRSELWNDYEPIAEWIEGFLPSEAEGRVRETEADLREAAREQFDFPVGVAEEQDKNDLLETFVRTRSINRALQAGYPLVRGRKGTGKTAIFRHLLEEGEHFTIKVLAPSSGKSENASFSANWMMKEEGFREIEKLENVEWSQFWRFYIALACHLQGDLFQEADPPAAFQACLSEEIDSQIDMVRAIKCMSKAEMAELEATEWLNELSQEVPASTLLLFDGLDTGFGNGKEDRKRREEAIEGLFSLFISQAGRLQNFEFKILLREDIWRDLQFENKSHLYGRSVLLEWNTKADYIEVVVRHALRSKAFLDLAKQTGAWPEEGAYQNRRFRDLPEEQVYALWYLLVSERMRGAKTTYTYNWVWKRLADGGGDRSPRTLLQLFQKANEWEKEESKSNTYDKSIIRPRALIESLDEVSSQALDALVNEEFQELDPFVKKLHDIGRTPVDAHKLNELDMDEELELAREVGLLEVYEGTKEDVQRFKVPDLYRLGIGMTRKGRA